MAVEVMTGDCVRVVSRGTWPGACSDYMQRRNMGFVKGVGAGPQWCLGVVQSQEVMGVLAELSCDLISLGNLALF